MTKLEVINAAFDMIGEPVIDSLSSTYPRALCALRQWDFALREVLGAAHWNFAKARTTLTASVTAPDFGWDYQYPLPSDYLQMVALNEDEDGTPGDDYEIETGMLLTDADEADIQYIYYPSESGMDTFVDGMDELALHMLVTLLAAKIATPIAKDGGKLGMMLEQKYRIKITEARTRNLNERSVPAKDERYRSLSLASRLGSSATGSSSSSSTSARGSLPHVDTIEELRALSHIADGAIVLVSGYYAAGDGGGGTFELDEGSTATDNGGTIIAPADGRGRWMLRVPAYGLTVRNFGAKGDGVTNDAAAIIAAHDVSAAAGSSLFFPAGTFRFYVPTGTSVGISFGENASWIGDGIDRTTIRVENDAGEYVTFFSVNGNDCRWSGFTVDNQTSGILCALWNIANGSRCVWSDLMVLGNGATLAKKAYFIGLQNNPVANDCEVRNCIIKDLVIGVWSTDTLATKVSGWKFRGNTFEGNFGSALELNSASLNANEGWWNVVIADNIFISPRYSPAQYSLGSIAFSNVDTCAIVGNLFIDHDPGADAYATQAIHIEDICNNVTISANQFLRCKTPIVATLVGRVVVSDNVFRYRDTPYAAATGESFHPLAIQFYDASPASNQVVISNNVIENFQLGIEWNGLPNAAVIDGNNIAGCYVAMKGRLGRAVAGNRIKSCTQAFVVGGDAEKYVAIGRNTVETVDYWTVIDAPAGTRVVLPDGIARSGVTAEAAPSATVLAVLMRNVSLALGHSAFSANTGDGTADGMDRFENLSYNGSSLSSAGVVENINGSVSSTGAAVGSGILSISATNGAAAARYFQWHWAFSGALVIEF
jgi:hypothetical protein